MAEQRRFVRQQFVQAAVERVFFNQPIIRVEKIAHRAVLEPQPVQPPLATWIDQPVAHQGL